MPSCSTSNPVLASESRSKSGRHSCSVNAVHLSTSIERHGSPVAITAQATRQIDSPHSGSRSSCLKHSLRDACPEAVPAPGRLGRRSRQGSEVPVTPPRLPCPITGRHTQQGSVLTAVSKISTPAASTNVGAGSRLTRDRDRTCLVAYATEDRSIVGRSRHRTGADRLVDAPNRSQRSGYRMPAAGTIVRASVCGAPSRWAAVSGLKPWIG
ncbi:hypothetical protein SAMN04489812_1213 [Microlunatus soli]|uniref:Uncharacterized protein n=1 Tax=Microlunatus soli TaxID=630515 RepID=A0A1H1QBQ7_9ACTN|nr:hypothetical protein SAMN04489812_1213 [Microlunatus soli]